MKSRSDRRQGKKNKKKRLPSFLLMLSKVQHLKGLMTFGDKKLLRFVSPLNHVKYNDDHVFVKYLICEITL